MNPSPVPAADTATAAPPTTDGTTHRGLPVVPAAPSRPGGTPVALRTLSTTDRRG